MYDRKDLKLFSRKELEDILLGYNDSPWIAPHIKHLLERKRDERLTAAEKKIKDLFAKMTFKEKMIYISAIDEEDHRERRLDERILKDHQPGC